MKPEHKEYIFSLFSKKNTALLGSDIVKLLSDHFQIKSATARKILNTSLKEEVLYSSKPLRFAHGQYGYSTIKNRSVFRQLLSNRSGVFVAYNLMLGSFASETELIKIAQSIYTHDNERDALRKLISDVEAIEQVKTLTFQGCTFYSACADRNRAVSEGNLETQYLELTREAKICALVCSYCETINLISDAVYRSAEEPYKLVGGYLGFDAIGYSTLGYSNGKTTYLFDVQLNQKASPDSVKRFQRRIKAFTKMQANGNKRYYARPVGVLVTVDINQSLKNKVDPNKQMLWIGLRQLFGRSIDSLLWVLGQNAICGDQRPLRR